MEVLHGYADGTAPVRSLGARRARAWAVTFRRAGFLAAIVLRVAMYLVWHVAYGTLICAC